MASADDLIANINRQATEMVRKAVADALAPYGELRQEWATRDGSYIDEVNIYATEAEAFAALYSGEDVVRRFVGDWVAVGGRVAPDAAADGHSATQAGAQTDSGHGDGSHSSTSHGEAQEADE